MTKKVQVDENLVKKTAILASLNLSSEEAHVYMDQLAEILGYVETLNEVDTENIEPTYQTIDGQKNVFRDDVETKGFTQEEALSQAKRKYKGYFVVERILHDR